jgi:hypothetical protein
MSMMTRSQTDEWRARWLSVAQAFRLTEKEAHAEEANLIEKILAEQAEAAERDVEDNRRAMRERVGPVQDVAQETSYDPAYLYQLVRDGRLENYNPDGRPLWLRYADVWALKGVPIPLIAAATPVSREQIVVRVVQ